MHTWTHAVLASFYWNRKEGLVDRRIFEFKSKELDVRRIKWNSCTNFSTSDEYLSDVSECKLGCKFYISSIWNFLFCTSSDWKDFKDLYSAKQPFLSVFLFVISAFVWTRILFLFVTFSVSTAKGWFFFRKLHVVGFFVVQPRQFFPQTETWELVAWLVHMIIRLRILKEMQHMPNSKLRMDGKWKERNRKNFNLLKKTLHGQRWFVFLFFF